MNDKEAASPGAIGSGLDLETYADYNHRVKHSNAAPWWKLDLHVLPIAMMMYFLGVMDRTNVANASVAGMLQDLQISNHQYSMALTVTFIPYILIELPSNLVIKKYGAPYLLSLMVTLWGIATVLQGFITSYRAFIVCRFFVGLFEGGFTPGIVFYLASFYPRYRLQFRVGLMASFSALAPTFSGLIGAAAQKHLNGTLGKPSWAWIFIIEGSATVFFGIIFFFITPSSPSKTRFLSPEEKEQITNALHLDPARVADDPTWPRWNDVFSSLLKSHVIIVATVSFLVGVQAYGLAYFTPTIIRSLGHSDASAQLLSAIPSAVSVVVTIIASLLSDKYRCRGPFLLFPALICVAGFSVFIATPSATARYGSLFLFIPLTYTMLPVVNSWMSNNAETQTERAVCLALNGILLNAGGIFSIWLFATLSLPPHYSSGVITLLVFMLVVAILSCVNILWLYRKNRVRWEVSQREDVPLFIYTV